MARESNRNLQLPNELWFCTTYEQAEQAVQEPIATLDAVLESDNEGHPSLLASQLVPAPAPDFFKSNHFASPQVRDMMRQMAQKKAERIHANQVDLILSKAAEKALSDALFAGNEAAIDALGTSAYHFVMPTLTEMVATGGRDKIFDWNIERGTHFSTFIDTFVQRALTSSQFVRSVEKFTMQIGKETTQAIELDM